MLIQSNKHSRKNIFINKEFKPLVNKQINKSLNFAANEQYLSNLANINRLHVKTARTVSFGKGFEDSVMEFFNPANPKLDPDKKLITPDEYQKEAARGLHEGKDVIVTAPTGMGKTAIAVYAISKNMQDGKRTFYTTPLKALSNQKFLDFQKIWGEDNVGLNTGDTKINLKAPVIVMTTEIYRNMLVGKDDKQLDNVKTVVFDEFHYMNDEDRGTVWEESVMMSPKNIQLLPLSATMGNVDMLSEWMNKVKGAKTRTVNVPESMRHVPLKFHAYLDDRVKPPYLKDLPINSQSLKEAAPELVKNNKPKNTKKDRIVNLVNVLNEGNKLPAIFFIFSKNDCDTAMNKVYEEAVSSEESGENKPLLTKDEQKEVKRIIDDLEGKDKYFGADFEKKYKPALIKGIAVHNAGMLPAYKNLVEQLADNGLVKVIFSTETLAAGINIPAKTTVFSSLQKPTGEKDDEGKIVKRYLEPSEMKQMAGRAGRRGMDSVGHVIVMKEDHTILSTARNTLMKNSNNIESHFKPSYSFLLGFLNKGNRMSQVDEVLDKSFMNYLPSKDKLEGGHKEKPVDGLAGLAGVLKAQTNNDVSLARTNTKNKLNSMKKILENKGYIEKVKNSDVYKPTIKGEIAANLRGTNEVFLTELITQKKLNDLNPYSLAAVVSTLTDSHDESFSGSYKKSGELVEDLPFNENLKGLSRLSTEITKEQKQAGFNQKDSLIEGNVSASKFIYQWAISDNTRENWGEVIKEMKEYKAQTSPTAGKRDKTDDITENIPSPEGELVSTTLRTVDFLKQIHNCSEKLAKDTGDESFSKLAENADIAVGLIQKGPTLGLIEDYNIKSQL